MLEIENDPVKIEEMKMDIHSKIGHISLIMSDAYYFTKMRTLLEGVVNQQEYEPLITMVNQFYNLCKYVEKEI